MERARVGSRYGNAEQSFEQRVFLSDFSIPDLGPELEPKISRAVSWRMGQKCDVRAAGTVVFLFGGVTSAEMNCGVLTAS